jgi:cell wall-associated NlpC family hydrolase
MLTALLLAALMTISLFPFASFAEETGTVTGSYVYIRSGAGTGYAVVGGCLKGTSVTIQSEENGWLKVSANGVTGYMSAAYVERGAAVSYGTVKGSFVNLRQSADVNAPIITVVAAGTQLPILEQLDGWYKVAYSETAAYISADYFGVGSDSGTASVSGTGRVRYDVVNLRSGPGTTYSVVASLLEGRELTVTAEVNGWYRVDFNGTEAYILKDLLSLGEGAVVPTGSIDVTGTGRVTGAVVNLRSDPGTGYSVIAQVKAGSSYSVLGESNGWYRIRYNGVDAYISSSYMTVSADDETVTVGTVTVDLVNIRGGAGTDSEVVGQAVYGDTFTILSKSGSWFRVSDAAGRKGYIAAAYLSTSVYARGSGESGEAEEDAPLYYVSEMTGKGQAVADSVNSRRYPTTDSAVIGSLSNGDKASVTGYSNGWYRITFNGLTGFVNGNYFLCTESGSAGGGESTTGPAETAASTKKTKKTTTAASEEEPPEQSEPPEVEPPVSGPASDIGQQLVDYAMQFIGIPYRYGGNSPSIGFDCSGLTQYVYAHFGYKINRTSQYKEGVSVSYSDLKPGDLVFFNTTGYGIGHVGMYVGNGQFIHAPSAGKTVRIERLDTGYYYNRFVCAVRIV